MKKIIVLAALAISINGYTQITKDSLLNMMVKEACADLDKKDLSKIDKANIQNEIGMLLMPTFMNHSSEIEAVYGGGMSDMETMQKMGMDLGMKLSTKCPKFIELSMAMAGKKGGAKDPFLNEPAKETRATENLTGTLLAVTAGDITTLIVKDAKGKMIKLYWMEYFENADTLKNSSKTYLNKKVLVDYMEQSIYNAATKNYKTIKIITGINLP